MKTIRYREIDGEKIVVGFDKLNVDPVSTKKRASVLMEDTPQARELEKAHLAVERAETFKEHKAAGAKFTQAYLEYQAELQKVLSANVVYFPARKGEVILIEEYDGLLEKFRSLEKGQRLTLGGEILEAKSDG